MNYGPLLSGRTYEPSRKEAEKMLGVPHSHELIIRELDGRDWLVTYGDQNEHVYRPVFRNAEHKLERAVRAIVARHDAASVAAGQREQLMARATKRFSPDRWGSEQLGNE